MQQKVFLQHMGNSAYQPTWDYQESLLAYNVNIKQAQRNAQLAGTAYSGKETQHHFLLVEHPHVYTLGKSGDAAHLLASAEVMALKQATFVKTNRGGDITYHGPGQIVGYPILDLEKIKPDLVWYMRSLEEVIIQTLAHYNIKAERLPGSTGVWLDATVPHRARKICAMGVRTSRWVTMHGFALNVNTNLNYFDLIVPCGISDKAVTSMEKELGAPIEIAEVEQKIIEAFESVFEVEVLIR